MSDRLPFGIGDFIATFKGDTPGHPFRGNQYDGGSGGGSSDEGGSSSSASGGGEATGSAKPVKDMTKAEIVKPIHDGIVDKINQGYAIPLASYTGGGRIENASSIRLSKDGNHMEVTRRGSKAGNVKWDTISDNTLDNWASKLNLPGPLDWEMAKYDKGKYAGK